MADMHKKYHRFAHAETKGLHWDEMGIPPHIRKKIIGLAWRHFYKFSDKHAYHMQPTFRLTMRRKGMQAPSHTIVLKPLDNWLHHAFFVKRPIYIINPQDRDNIRVASYWENDTFEKIFHCAHGQAFEFTHERKKMICQVETIPDDATLSTRDMEDLLQRAQQNTCLQQKAETEQLDDKQLFNLYCVMYCIEKMLQLLREQNAAPARAHDKCQQIKDELMQVAWHPDYFYDWCLDIQEQQEITARWKHVSGNKA